jgi:sorbose reductase
MLSAKRAHSTISNIKAALPQELSRNTETYLTANVMDLFSLKGQTIVITGGGRGIGLALAFAVAEAGANIAVIDALPGPHEHFKKLEKLCNVKYYK